MAKMKRKLTDEYFNNPINLEETAESAIIKKIETDVNYLSYAKKMILQEQKIHSQGAQRAKSIFIHHSNPSWDGIIDSSPELKRIVDIMKQSAINNCDSDKLAHVLLSNCEIDTGESPNSLQIDIRDPYNSTTRKVSNIRFTFKNFLKYSLEMAIFISLISQKDILSLIGSGINFINYMVEDTTIELSFNYAILLKFLYEKTLHNQSILEDDFKKEFIEYFNTNYVDNKNPLINDNDVTKYIKQLKNIGCIDIVGGNIIIIESIRL